MTERSPLSLENEALDRFLGQLNLVLEEACFEGDGILEREREKKPLVFIVGAPRSGTTLAYQILAKALPLDYIDNIAARFWLRPSVGLQLSRILLGPDKHKDVLFASRLGESQGLAGPHEFGHFWSHWFNFDQSATHQLSAAELAEVDSAGFKAALGREFLSYSKAGFLFKNLTCGLQASYITDMHPNSLFVHVERDLRSTVASLLEWRNRAAGGYENWLSLKTAGYPFASLKSDPVAQVAAQISEIRGALGECLSRTGMNSIHFRYEDICADPMAFVKQITKKLGEMGVAIEPRKIVIPSFEVQAQTSLPADMTARLDEVLSTGLEQ